MRFCQTLVAISVLALSGCRISGPRPFDQIEREMNDDPVRATFQIPPPCEYVSSPRESSAVVGKWSATGVMDGVQYYALCLPPKRWCATWSKSYLFSADGTFLATDAFGNGWTTYATGRWTYSDGVLVLDVDTKNGLRDHCEYRLHWIDDGTFDLRRSNEVDGHGNSLVVSYDRSGCERRTRRFPQGKTGEIFDELYSPLRYKRTGEGTLTPSVRVPAADLGSPKSNSGTNMPSRKDAGRASTMSVAVEIDSIPL